MTKKTEIDIPMEDGELVRRVISRDEEALGTIVTKYSSQVFTAAFRVLHKWPEAQEVTQDVFLALWRSPEKFDSKRGALLTWLLIISRSRAIDLLRKVLAYESREIELTPELSGSRQALHLPFAPDSEILVEELLDRLPEGQGRILQKVYVEGYALAEFASAAGVPLGTIKSRARCALRKLKSELLETSWPPR
ncbi:MAG TPA: sigma-70 family RNA polymerase sigma factor [Bryobacteraceae bacterium]|jgi:RNA polymerase sigma-70 factor, ECF subfamily|nr:sigma-70 family RNA polymerase sigma factor [Bryobacteraceae bacterium]